MRKIVFFAWAMALGLTVAGIVGGVLPAAYAAAIASIATEHGG